MKLSEFASKFLFTPLRMKSTLIRDNIQCIIPHLAVGYNYNVKNKKWIKYDSFLEIVGTFSNVLQTQIKDIHLIRITSLSIRVSSKQQEMALSFLVFLICPFSIVFSLMTSIFIKPKMIVIIITTQSKKSFHK